MNKHSVRHIVMNLLQTAKCMLQWIFGIFSSIALQVTAIPFCSGGIFHAVSGTDFRRPHSFIPPVNTGISGHPQAAVVSLQNTHCKLQPQFFSFPFFRKVQPYTATYLLPPLRGVGMLQWGVARISSVFFTADFRHKNEKTFPKRQKIHRRI